MYIIFYTHTHTHSKSINTKRLIIEAIKNNNITHIHTKYNNHILYYLL